jgi:hypothetical protein
MVEFFAFMSSVGKALVNVLSAFRNLGVNMDTESPAASGICGGGTGGASLESGIRKGDIEYIGLLLLGAELRELLTDIDQDTDDDEGVRSVLGTLEDIVDRQLGKGGLGKLGKLDFRKFH